MLLAGRRWDSRRQFFQAEKTEISPQASSVFQLPNKQVLPLAILEITGRDDGKKVKSEPQWI
jgi:hypothetical protein